MNTIKNRKPLFFMDRDLKGRRNFRHFHGGFIEIHAEEPVQLAPVAILVRARDETNDGLKLAPNIYTAFTHTSFN